MKKSVVILFAFPFLISCEKLLFEKELDSTKPIDNFEYLWKQCDEKYSYFELKKIDWDKIHTKYAAKINNGMSDEVLFKELGGMLTELKDDHTNLISYFNISFFGIANKKPDNFDWQIVKNNYLPADYYITGSFVHDFIADDQVGYIRLSSFEGNINNNNLGFVLHRYKDTKGLILDLRENGGGVINDAYEILSRFVETKTLVLYSRLKNGPEHNDFSVDEPGYVTPSDQIRYTNKVMVLVDRGTYSAGSLFSLATKALPNLVLVGDTTGGGLGLPNGGQLPNGWTYRFSIAQALDLNLNNSYENGVPPDIQVSFDWNDLTKDEIIERALLEIL